MNGRSAEPERRSGEDRRASLAFHLTPREVEVLALVLLGLGNKEIGKRLGLAEQSIKDHVRLAMTGDAGFDPNWIPQLFREAEPQICVARGSEIRYEAANEAFVRAVGNRPLVGRTMREAFPELEGQGVFEMVEHVYASGEPAIVHERSSKWDRGDGVESRLVDLVVQPLRDESGAVNGVMSFAVDVTDAVQQRRRAELVGEELATVLDLVPSGVIVVDAEGTIVSVNAAARRIAGMPFDMTKTMDLQARVEFESRTADGRLLSAHEMPIGRALRGETVVDEEFSFSSTGGRSVRVRTAVRPLRGVDGDVRGAIAVFTTVE